MTESDNSSSEGNGSGPHEVVDEGFNYFGSTGTSRTGGFAPASESEETSSEESLDSATLRAQEAKAKLVDYGDDGNEEQSSVLPSAASAFSKVEGPPAFLDPEATRPLAVNPEHGIHLLQPPGQKDVENRERQNKKDKKKIHSGEDFDVARLAPQLGTVSESAKRGLPEGAVIEAKPKKYKTEEATQIQYTDSEVALMGGHIAGGNDLNPLQGHKIKQPMEVTDFMDKGGMASLPRKNQDRRNKEKVKRMRGQSSIGTWKSEAEMALRQQYD